MRGRLRWAAGAAVVLLATAGAGCASRAAPAPQPQPSPAHALAELLSGFIWPLPLGGAGDLSSQYGMRGTRHHDGVDLRSRHGDPIFAAREGTVRFSGTMRGYGETVIVDHGGGVTTLYAHASQRFVHAGERVSRGQVIAAVGATGNASGPHLHFEVLWGGVALDPTFLLPRLAGR